MSHSSDSEDKILALSVNINQNSFKAGEQIHCSIVIYNGGVTDFTNASITMVLPSMIRFLLVDPQIKASTSGNITLFGVGLVPKQDRKKFDILCQIDDDIEGEIVTDIEFTAVTDDTRKVISEVNFLIKGEEFNILAQPALILTTKLHPPLFSEILHATFHIMNQGEKDAENAVLSLSLPSEPKLIPVIKRGFEICHCGNHYLVCLGTIKSKELKKITIDFKTEDKNPKSSLIYIDASVSADKAATVNSVKDGSNAKVFHPNRTIFFSILQIENNNITPLIPFHEYISQEVDPYVLPISTTDRQVKMECLINSYDDPSSYQIEVFKSMEDTQENLIYTIPLIQSGIFCDTIQFLIPANCNKLFFKYTDLNPNKGKLAEIEVDLS